MTFESHPLQPFLPEQGRILFLGSFPPPRARWSMDFFYPNFINDFWRVMGLIHYGDSQHFVVPGERRFNLDLIIPFCEAQGLGFYDTATRVCRLRDNASDDHLEIVQPTDVALLLRRMPQCHDIVTTGGKASEELQRQLQFPMPRIGEYAEGDFYLHPSAPRHSHPNSPPSQGGAGVVWAGEAPSDIPSADLRPLRWWRMPSTSRAYPLRLERKAELYARLFA